MISRCDSAAMVPNTSELLPEPEMPVNTVSRRFGISMLTSLRLFTRAPCTRIRSWLSAACGAGDCVSVVVAIPARLESRRPVRFSDPARLTDAGLRGGAECLEAHRGARDARELAELRCKPVVDQDPKRFAHARYARELVGEFVEAKHARMRSKQRIQDRALGGIGISHAQTLHERVFVMN